MLIIPDHYHSGKLQHSTRSKNTVVKSQQLVNKQFHYPVTLLWNCRPSMEQWNEITAWTVEHFGLPGTRYRTEIATEYMTWFFETQQDQLIFTLAWGNDESYI
jgi:hypothetical protein